MEGICSCTNVIGETQCDLKPCRVGQFLFSGDCSLPHVTLEEFGMVFAMVLRWWMRISCHNMNVRIIFP